jgi:Zn-dependent protease with chaperone function
VELLAVIGIIVGLVVLYFFLGVALKFLWGWWILIVATPLSIYVGVAFGWWGAIGGIAGFCIALSVNNEWHDTRFYLAVSGTIDRAFYFKDT